MDYEDGSLPAEQSAEFDRHLAVRPPCVDYLNTYRATIHLTRSIGQGWASNIQPVPEDLIRTILAARSPR